VPEKNEYRETVRTERFAVRGTTPIEIRRNTAKSIPRAREHSRDLARTDSEFCTTWSFAPGESSCKLAAYRMELHLTFVMPQWVSSADAPPATRTWWDEDYALIAAHEQGHAAISIEGAKAMYQAGIALTEAKTCDELDSKLQHSYETILEETRNKHIAYDEAHGTLDHL
jgi:predicted secreted Zn-dependent protease